MDASSEQDSPGSPHHTPVRPPSVYLESTVIAQGLPWPENLETAREMDAAIRQAGASPAMIAVIDGSIRVGLDSGEIQVLARSAAPPAHLVPRGLAADDPLNRPHGKANRRDISVVVAARGCAATTVSATLWLARRHEGGPCIMATGGLGGVHRFAAQTFDVSTDLDELASAHGSLVVCSGCKSILDVPATLEALETRGVAIVGYRTSELPAFFTAASGLALEHRVETPQAVADLLRTHRALGLPGAIVLANPVPAAEAVDPLVVEEALVRALDEARQRGLSGKEVTPFLLDAVRLATGGQSLRANRALLVSNARLAAEVAVALAG